MTINKDFQLFIDGKSVAYNEVGFAVEIQSITHLLLTFEDLDVILATTDGELVFYLKYYGQEAARGLCSSNSNQENELEIFENNSQTDDLGTLCFMPMVSNKCSNKLIESALSRNFC